MCYINPKVDFAFKKLFGGKENKDLLLALINAIVSETDQVFDLKRHYITYLSATEIKTILQSHHDN